MTQPLFLHHDLTFQKIAVETQLPEDPNQWPNEILDEVYRQVPYVADFDLDVNMDRVDGERGFGFGHIEVGSKSEAPATSKPGELEAAGIRKVRIPVIIKESRLQPFDVLITDDSKMLPLTEQRLRQALFRPQAFDVTSRSPGDPSIINQLFPPYRQNYGFAGGGTTVGTKVSSDRSLLEVALVRAHESDLDAFKSSLQDHATKLAFSGNHAAHQAIEMIAEARPSGLDKQASIRELVAPTVWQLSRMGGGYLLKTASHHYWEPVEEVLDRGAAVARCGYKTVLAADLDGSVTSADQPGVKDEAEAEAPAVELVGEAGRYQVETEDGQPLQGLVIPNLLDIDGVEKPIALFTDGQNSAVQADIAGTPMGPADQIGGVSAAEATGYGCFYSVVSGTPTATIPFNIKASYQGPAGVIQMAESFDGRPVEFSIQPAIQAPSAVDGTLMIPDSWTWLPLGSSESVALVGSPPDVGKQASLIRYMTSVELRAGGPDSFSISGQHVEKLAGEERNFLSQDDALFLLGGLGADLQQAQAKMAQAYSGFRPVQVRVGRTIKTAEEVRGESSIRASNYLSRTPTFRHRLWKEAAVIPDPVAVDTVLSLGFLNPENVAAFIGYLPVIDEAQRRMCELLIASRLGLTHVPTPALEKSIRATEEVVEGLRSMSFQA
jgi:hypothetical protein